jgi:hypothetical protein
MTGGVMGILFLLVGVAVIGGAALLISGRWRDGLPEAPRDAPAAPLAQVPVGRVGSQALDEIMLDEVDGLIDRLGEEIAVRDQEIAARDEELRRLRGNPPPGAAGDAPLDPA